MRSRNDSIKKTSTWNLTRTRREQVHQVRLCAVKTIRHQLLHMIFHGLTKWPVLYTQALDASGIVHLHGNADVAGDMLPRESQERTKEIAHELGELPLGKLEPGFHIFPEPVDNFHHPGFRA